VTIYGDDSVLGRVLMPRGTAAQGYAGNDLTVNSAPFTVPKGALSLTVHVPAMTGTGATVKLQAMFPRTDDQASETWTDLSVFNLADGTFVALDGIVESTSVTIPVAATGGGVLRFVASETQAAAQITIGLSFI
jgi:hypothetical protein